MVRLNPWVADLPTFDEACPDVLTTDEMFEVLNGQRVRLDRGSVGARAKCFRLGTAITLLVAKAGGKVP
jgi:hypothetical protein